MGILDGAAAGLMSRLEHVGVPRVIAYVISQCAYVSERKRHPDIPRPAIHKSEITWLVDQYEKQLRGVHDPVAKAALVQGLCVKVFGPNAEEIFVAGYPELAPNVGEAAATSQDQETDDAELDAEMMIYTSAARYIGYEFDDDAGAAQIACYFPVEDAGVLTGLLIVLGGTVGFYEPTDLAVQDPAEGTPIVRVLAQLTGCSVIQPDSADFDEYKFIEVSQGDDDEILLRLDFGQNYLFFAIPFGQLERVQQEDVDVSVSLALDVFDKQLARAYSQS